MKVTKEQTQQNRQALLEAAGALFKRHGIDGVGVADICREAGLTHGALYKHFADKQDLAAQAFAQAFREGYDRVTAPRKGRPRTVATYLDNYLAPRVRDDLGAGCPLVATACETGRQSEGVSRRFAEAFRELRDGVEEVLPAGGPIQDTSALATVFVAAFIGAMALSRGVVKSEPGLADEVLAQVHAVLEALAQEGQAA